MPLLNGKCYSKARLDSCTAIVTGCNTGIGKETVLDFYRRGGHVIMACRDTEKANTALEDIKAKCSGEENLGSLAVFRLDLGSLVSVRQCAAQVLEAAPKIHLLVNNAGVMTCPEGKTEDGFETQLGTNHMGHFLFTLLLLPRMIQSKPARIVNVSSKAHHYGTIDFDDLNYERKPYKALAAYGQSKLANILFTKELAKRLQDNNIEGVNVYSLHPGVIATELGRHLDDTMFRGARFLMKMAKIFIKSPTMGAQTSIYCAVDEKCANETGLYYSDCVAIKPSNEAQNPEIAERFWEVSIKSVGLTDFNPFQK